MVRNIVRAVSAFLCFVSLMAALGGPARAQGAAYTCKSIQQSCIANVKSRFLPQATESQYISNCNKYYARAAATGVWPAFQSNPAQNCTR